VIAKLRDLGDNNSMGNRCYFNGKIIPLTEAKINPYDLGILRGYGVFDVMTTVNGKPFLLDEHWKRFQNSAKKVGLKIPISKKKYKKILKKLIEINRYKKYTIRMILTGGMSSDTLTYCGKVTFYILAEKFAALPEKLYEKGAKVVTSEYQREMPEVKTANYLYAIKHQGKKQKNGALEMVYTYKNKALEAATSNFFIVKNNALITPKNNILAGITRNLVIRLARRKRYKVQERDVRVGELFSADEMFLTATNKDIVPVAKADNKKIGDGKAGKTTKVLMEEFKRFVEAY
jgi:branched-chain amino acid aminotransferase